MVPTGEVVIGIGFLHDGVQIVDKGYKNIGMAAPSSGTSRRSVQLQSSKVQRI